MNAWLQIEQKLCIISNWLYFSEKYPYFYWKNRERLCSSIWSRNRNWSDRDFDLKFQEFLNSTIIKAVLFSCQKDGNDL